MRATTSCTSGTCEPERIDKPTTCARLLARGLDDLRRREADAFVDHIHAGVARAHRNLLGAVGMAVEAGLADHEFQPAAELARDAVDIGAQIVEADGSLRGARPTPVGARYSPKLSRRAKPHSPVVTPALAQAIEGRHDVAVFSGRGAQLPQRRRDRFLVARAAPGLEALDLLRPRPAAKR